eukprot:m.250450 g.250450  ORF g.250450 m.250450 type:complete len:99 (+) comp16725_c0_seq1:38-334(+)
MVLDSHIDPRFTLNARTVFIGSTTVEKSKTTHGQQASPARDEVFCGVCHEWAKKMDPSMGQEYQNSRKNCVNTAAGAAGVAGGVFGAALAAIAAVKYA